jgi:hypothetical protein
MSRDTVACVTTHAVTLELFGQFFLGFDILRFDDLQNLEWRTDFMACPHQSLSIA